MSGRSLLQKHYNIPPLIIETFGRCSFLKKKQSQKNWPEFLSRNHFNLGVKPCG